MATLRDHIKEANEAHTDLNIFEAVVAMLEGGTMSSGAQPYDFRVIALCKQAQSKMLKRYDRAMEKAGAPYPTSKS